MLALLIVLVISMVLTSLWGWAIERIAYRPLRGSFRLAPLISAIGVSIFLSNFVQVAQGARNKPTPPMMRDVIVLFQGESGYNVAAVLQADRHHGLHRRAARGLLVSGPEDVRSGGRSGPASRTAKWRRCSGSTSTGPSR